MGALYYALLLVVDVLAYACNDILQFRMGGNKSVWVESMADCIAWENVLIYNYSFGKTNIREIGSRNTLEERMDKVSGISDIHHFMIAWMLVVVQSSQAGSGKIPIVLAFSLVGLNVFIYGLLYDILQKEVRTREYMVSMAKAEGKIQLYQKQTAFIHDYQNQMQCVRTLLMKKITRQSSIWSRCVMWVRMYGMLLIRII